MHHRHSCAGSHRYHKSIGHHTQAHSTERGGAHGYLRTCTRQPASTGRRRRRRNTPTSLSQREKISLGIEDTDERTRGQRLACATRGIGGALCTGSGGTHTAHGHRRWHAHRLESSGAFRGDSCTTKDGWFKIHHHIVIDAVHPCEASTCARPLGNCTRVRAIVPSSSGTRTSAGSYVRQAAGGCREYLISYPPLIFILFNRVQRYAQIGFIVFTRSQCRRRKCPMPAGDKSECEHGQGHCDQQQVLVYLRVHESPT